MRHTFLGLALIGSLMSTLSADDKVSGVLRSEISAESFERRAALQAIRATTESDAVWWQSGYVRLNGDWQPLESATPIDASLWRDYRSRRAATNETSAAQVKFADWCRQKKLDAQERAHITRALWMGQSVNQEKIFKRLGYQRVGRAWFTDEELKEYALNQRSVARTARKLVPRLEALAVRLERNPDERAQILTELSALVADEASLAVFEQTFWVRSERAALATVEVLSSIPSFRASQTLARLALASDADAVRSAAIEQLRQRRWEDFIPMTLDLLYHPVEFQGDFAESFSATQSLPHRREWQFLFLREGRQRIDAATFAVVDSASPPHALLTNLALARVRSRQTEDIRRAGLDELRMKLSQMDFANDRIEILNERAGNMLAGVTGLPDAADPQFWWTWWDQTVEVPAPEEKAVVVVSEDEVDTRLPLLISSSCLAAGTPIWTAQGFVDIEKIKLGDLVLAKDIATGELAYKPVLHTTLRRNATLTNLTVGDETFTASGGHNFWISGRGWMRTNQLTEPLTAHTATGAVRLTAEPLERTGNVFNLVVADFHTYFVGRSLVLGHDVLAPAPTDHLVPGLKPKFAAK